MLSYTRLCYAMLYYTLLYDTILYSEIAFMLGGLARCRLQRRPPSGCSIDRPKLCPNPYNAII